MNEYKYIAFQQSNHGEIKQEGTVEAISYPNAALRVARMLGYIGQQTFQGCIHRYISQISSINAATAPLRLQITRVDTANCRVKYFAVQH